MKKYDTDYFQERDVLIPHLAQLIESQMLQKNLNKVLDVGCGTGLLVKYLNDKGFRATGCDISKEAVARARKVNSQNAIQKAPATKLPYKDNSFDLVTAISVIEHLSKSQGRKFIQEARRVLAASGYIFLVTPNFSTPLRTLQGQKWFAYSDPTHITFYSPGSLSMILAQSGFKNIQKNFQIKYTSSLEWEFPSLLAKLPTALKQIIIYLIFATPFSVIRNSTWMLAQKND